MLYHLSLYEFYHIASFLFPITHQNSYQHYQTICTFGKLQWTLFCFKNLRLLNKFLKEKVEQEFFSSSIEFTVPMVSNFYFKWFENLQLKHVGIVNNLNLHDRNSLQFFEKAKWSTNISVFLNSLFRNKYCIKNLRTLNLNLINLNFSIDLLIEMLKTFNKLKNLNLKILKFDKKYKTNLNMENQLILTKFNLENLSLQISECNTIDDLNFLINILQFLFNNLNNLNNFNFSFKPKDEYNRIRFENININLFDNILQNLNNFNIKKLKLNISINKDYKNHYFDKPFITTFKNITHLTLMNENLILNLEHLNNLINSCYYSLIYFKCFINFKGDFNNLFTKYTLQKLQTLILFGNYLWIPNFLEKFCNNNTIKQLELNNIPFVYCNDDNLINMESIINNSLQNLEELTIFDTIYNIQSLNNFFNIYEFKKLQKLNISVKDLINWNNILLKQQNIKYLQLDCFHSYLELNTPTTLTENNKLITNQNAIDISIEGYCFPSMEPFTSFCCCYKNLKRLSLDILLLNNTKEFNDCKSFVNGKGALDFINCIDILSNTHFNQLVVLKLTCIHNISLNDDNIKELQNLFINLLIRKINFELPYLFHSLREMYLLIDDHYSSVSNNSNEYCLIYLLFIILCPNLEVMPFLKGMNWISIFEQVAEENEELEEITNNELDNNELNLFLKHLYFISSKIIKDDQLLSIIYQHINKWVEKEQVNNSIKENLVRNNLFQEYLRYEVEKENNNSFELLF
ncbi:hypothetical protein ABK040_003417 [Willaertia magna]